MPRPVRPSAMRVESLEDRLVPAGLVLIAAAGTEVSTSVQITGDGGDNSIEISTGANGTIVIRGLDGTRVNDLSDQLVFRLPSPLADLTIDLKSGEDQVVVSARSEADPRWPYPAAISPFQLSGGLTVLGGDDSDVVLLRNVDVGGTLNVQGGLGNDTVVAESTKAASLAVYGATGANSVLLRSVTVGGASLVKAGSGRDAVGLISSTFTGDASLNLGTGADRASVEGSTFGGKLTLPNGGAGFDRYTEGLEGLNTIAGAFTHAGWSETLEQVADVHFTYEGEEGPGNWGALTPAFLLTSAGRQQTPVAIDTASTVKTALPDLSFTYADNTNLAFIHNGHTTQVNFPSPATNSVTVGGNKYDLLQFHLHTESEHTVDGVSFPLELHLVHRDANGNLLVVTVFITQGTADNPAFAPLVANLPDKTNNPNRTIAGPFNPLSLLPTDRHYFAYSGSLTTPPGTEGVSFGLFTTPVQLSAAQIQAIKNALGEPNNRPTQPVNNRVVFQSV